MHGSVLEGGRLSCSPPSEMGPGRGHHEDPTQRRHPGGFCRHPGLLGYYEVLACHTPGECRVRSRALGAEGLDTLRCPRSCPGSTCKWGPGWKSPLPAPASGPPVGRGGSAGPGERPACAVPASPPWRGAGGPCWLTSALLCLTDETRGLPGEHGTGRPGGREGAGAGAEGGAHPWRGPGRA